MANPKRVVFKHEDGDPPMQYLYVDGQCVGCDHRISLKNALDALAANNVLDFDYQFLPDPEGYPVVVGIESSSDDTEEMEILELVEEVQWKSDPIFDEE